jgi:colanic acid biosynthesis glycosyl transferase WcaI
MSHVRFLPLQPAERLNELLALADLHLLPQRADAEDLVLPSKLSAMMASGRPVIATASPDSEVGKAVRQGGVICPPGDGRAFAAAIRELLRDSGRRQALGDAGRAWAQSHWDRRLVLERAVRELRAALAQN